MSVPSQKTYPYDFVRATPNVTCRMDSFLHPICELDAICNLPDDIQPDWLAEAKTLCTHIEEHPEWIYDGGRAAYNEWIPKIKARIAELEAKSTAIIKEGKNEQHY